MSQFGQFLPGSGGGAGIPIETVTGNSGGAVSPNGANNINIVGSGSVAVAGNPGTNTLTISVSGSSVVWQVITVNQTMASNNGYICNKAGLLSLLLPAASSVGDIIEVTGMNRAIGWSITQGAGQVIQFGTTATTVGVAGSLSSSQTYDSIKLVCNIANLSWIELSCQGNITVV